MVDCALRACSLTGLKLRQVFRLLHGLKHNGAASLVSKRRGRRRKSLGLFRNIRLEILSDPFEEIE